MTTARALFVGGYRIGHLCVALQFDHLLLGVDKTYIVTNVEKKHYAQVFNRYGIDLNQFEIIDDQELINCYPEILNWDPRPNDFRGTWMRQQALKLASCDFFSEDRLLIQDPDTFAVVPYQPFDDEIPNFFIQPGKTESLEYYKTFENCAGIARQTEDCLVSEYMPVYKKDWLSLKKTLETRNNTNFLDAILNAIPVSVFDGLLWPSEYEILANWAMTQRHYTTTVQKRCEISHINQIPDKLNIQDYNCYVDACANLADSIQFDFGTSTIPDFEKIVQDIATAISK